MRSNWLPEIVKRAQSGPYMKEADFDLKLTRRIKELVREYGIRYDANNLCPADDDMADRVWQAGLQLFVEMGAYCQSTERCIRFTKDEVLEILGQEPGAVTLGTGKDAVVMRHRGVEDPQRAIMHSGPTGLPSSEKISSPDPALLRAGAAGRLPRRRLRLYLFRRAHPARHAPGNPRRPPRCVRRPRGRPHGRPPRHAHQRRRGPAHLRRQDGRVRSRTPACARRTRSSSRRWSSSRPTSTSSRACAYLDNIGAVRVDLMTPLIGGVGGAAPGTAVVSVADHLLGVVLYDADYHMFSLTHLHYVNNTDPLGLWVQSMVGQALARNTKIVALNDIYVVSGPGTKDLFYECAAGAVVTTVAGFNMQGAGTTGGFFADRVTGLEARFIAEVSRASLGLTRQDAAELVKEILPCYQASITNPNRGRPFDEVYNIDTVQPTTEWLDMYYAAKEDLRRIGLKLA